MYQTTSKRPSRAILVACSACLAILAALLTGCSSMQIVRELPPPDLLSDCPIVVERLRTNGDLVNTILAYRTALSTCTADKASLREWAEDIK